MAPVRQVTTVALPGGTTQDLIIRVGDDPREMARRFALDAGLSPTVAAALERHVLSAATATAGAAAAAAATHERLYARAAETREKLEARRREQADSELQQARRARPSISWVSAQLAMARGAPGQDGGEEGDGDDEVSQQQRRDRLTSYAEMLHAEAGQAQQRRAAAVAAAATARVAREMAKMAAAPRLTLASSSRWPERLSVGNAATEARLMEARRQLESSELAACTFAPRTNSAGGSGGLGGDCDGGRRHSELLYREAEQRRARQEQARESAARRDALVPFSPQLFDTAASRASFARRMQRLGQQRRQDDGLDAPPPRPSLLPPVVQRLYAAAAHTEAMKAERERRDRQEARGRQAWRSKAAAEAVGASLHALGAERLFRARRAAEAEVARIRAQASAPKSCAYSVRLQERLALSARAAREG